jgi:exportin-1
LEDVIQYKWNLLPEKQKNGIKTFIVKIIITKSSDEKVLVQEKVLISKLDQVLVQVRPFINKKIIKQEWPGNWRNLIEDIVKASKSSESICENNMTIFKILSEEIFDFSNGKMTNSKISVLNFYNKKELKNSFTEEFSKIYELCEFVLIRAKKANLIHSTLKTLSKFLTWIPIGYIFETKLIEMLITKVKFNK